MTDPVLSAIETSRIALERRSQSRWIVGFSGGKDSTATLKVLLSAWKLADPRPRILDVIYCDTGVENPVLDGYIKRLFDELKRENIETGLPINPILLTAPVQDRFFVRIIGRGYPPPTNSFRWCTKSLRIKPVAEYISKFADQDAVVAVGLRANESKQRDRSMRNHGDGHWQVQKESTGTYDLFLPVLKLGVEEVWDAVFGLGRPKSICARTLELLYRNASGECPIIKAPQAAPCGSGRFGCWTCTVVRKDRSAEKLIAAGSTELRPFLQFRNWLAEIRNDPERRWKSRRNGSAGLGPFTLATRKEILQKIDELETQTRVEILSHEERGVIAALWELDDVPRLSFQVTNN